MGAKIVRVSQQDISADSLNPKKYIAKHHKAKQDYYRRLIRLVRCGYLPHYICEWLDITAKQFVDDTKALHDKGTVLSYDTRIQEEYRTSKPPSEMSKMALQDMLSDELFYRDCGLNKAQRGKLLCLTPSRHRDLLTASEHQDKQEDVDTELRNKSIAEVFVGAENKRGLKVELAKTWGLSRKAIDLILIKQGIDPTVTSKHKTGVKKNAKKKKRIISLYEKLRAEGSVGEGMVTHIGKVTSSSITYVGSVIKEYEKEIGPDNEK